MEGIKSLVKLSRKHIGGATGGKGVEMRVGYKYGRRQCQYVYRGKENTQKSYLIHF